MNPRTTGILALVAAGLGLFVYFYEIEGEVGRKAAEDDANRVHAGLDAGDIEAIAFETRDDVFARFERRGGRWWLVAPLESEADGPALDAIAGALADLPRAGTIGATEDLAGFGLGEGAERVEFRTADGTFGLRVGGTRRWAVTATSLASRTTKSPTSSAID